MAAKRTWILRTLRERLANSIKRPAIHQIAFFSGMETFILCGYPWAGYGGLPVEPVVEAQPPLVRFIDVFPRPRPGS